MSPSTATGVLFPATAFDVDFAWAENHPVADMFRAQAKITDCPTGELAAVLYAVRPDEKAFALSEPVGKIRQLMLEPAEKERLQRLYIELASAKPVLRQPRFRRPVVEEPKKPDVPPVKP